MNGYPLMRLFFTLEKRKKIAGSLNNNTTLMDGKIGTDIELAAGLLRSGKPVGMPTETVYGLAANGLNPDAVAQIFEIKNRPFFDPLILHVASIELAKQFTHSWSPEAEKLANHFWPGPLTLVLPKNPNVPDIVSSGNPTVAIRIPNHPVALSLLNAVEFPVAAPSANPFGYVSPTTSTHVFNQLGNKIPYILEGGPCNNGLESTIIACLPNEKPKILRLGSLSINDIISVIGTVDESLTQNSNPSAPGQLDQHYSPYCKLLPLTHVDAIPSPNTQEDKFAVLLYTSSENKKAKTMDGSLKNKFPTINSGKTMVNLEETVKNEEETIVNTEEIVGNEAEAMVIPEEIAVSENETMVNDKETKAYYKVETTANGKEAITNEKQIMANDKETMDNNKRVMGSEFMDKELLLEKNIDVYYLSENSDTREAAQNLFSMLRQFDELGYTHVWFQWAPEEGLGRAINDRLKRAAAKR